MGLSFEDLVAEAHKNVAADRETLKEVVVDIREVFKENPANIEIAQALARSCEGLSRANGQLIALAQLRLKEKGGKQESDVLSSDDTADVYDSIGDDHAPS